MITELKSKLVGKYIVESNLKNTRVEPTNEIKNLFSTINDKMYEEFESNMKLYRHFAKWKNRPDLLKEIDELTKQMTHLKNKIKD